MIAVLQCVEDGFIAWFGVKCSSSTAINVGTSRRSFLLPEGDVSKRSVAESNCLVARQGRAFRFVFLNYNSHPSWLPGQYFLCYYA